MTTPITPSFDAVTLDGLATRAGRIAILVSEDGRLDSAGRKVNALSRKSVERLVASDRFSALKPGDLVELAYPVGLEAEAVLVVKVPRKVEPAVLRRAGAAIARATGKADLTLCAPQQRKLAELVFGLTMRTYAYEDQKSGDPTTRGTVSVWTNDPEAVAAEYAPLAAVAAGVFLTRDLVSAPANVLTTTAFAEKLCELRDLGVEVEVLEEDELERLGMRTLLAVGQGSASPSKVVVMQWKGAETAPLALVGKGVVFDTGGISIKPAAGMEEMTMDMGGAGVVAGTMKAIATRKAAAHVVGLVGLVENMPSGTATRPGDVVKSMKGDTVEIINTDAEGRLVLADVLWYAQDRFNPCGIIDLATLTGAIIIALGSENAGVFSNDDAFCGALLKAAGTEGEGAWRMPMGDGYDALLKSHIADMKNIGGREGGSITAAQFLRRFVKPETPWCHIDIAGTTLAKGEAGLSGRGATGYGVMTLNRLIADRYEV